METEGAISLYYQNVRGLNSKLADFYNGTIAVGFDIYAITETWLDSGVANGEIFDQSYEVFRSDRNFHRLGLSRGGGVLLAVKSDFKPLHISLSSAFEELPSVDVAAARLNVGTGTLMLCCVYVPPNLPVSQYVSLFDAFCSLDTLLESKVLIVGDFNLPAYYERHSLPHPPGSVVALNDFMELFHFQQLNSILNSNQRLLDLVISDMDCSVLAAAVPLLDEDSHHPAMVIYLPISPGFSASICPSASNPYNWNFKKGNLNLLYQLLLGMNWDCLTNFNDVDNAVGYVYDELNHLFDLTIPKTRRQLRIYPPWFNGWIIRRIQLKKKLWKKYRVSGQESDLARYRQLRSSLKGDIRRAHSDYLKLLEERISLNPSDFWKHLLSKKGASMPSGFNISGEVVSDVSQIAGAFANYFRNSYRNSSILEDVSALTPIHDQLLTIESFTEDEVLGALNKLKGKLTAGPDQIPSFILKDCRSVFVRPLTIIFNLCLKSSVFPELWKVSKLCPIHKKGDRAAIENYRPISLVNNFSKVFEQLLFDRISAFFQLQIVDHQHGFMKGRSTVTNLFCFTQFVSTTLDERAQCDTIYTDFSKAFDQLDHGILLSKLRSSGFSTNLVRMLRSYLVDRKQFVLLRGHKSDLISASSGVPQGSVLGPLLFNIFVNDIGCDLDADVHYLLYADDLKLYSRINSYDDCLRLQSSLDRIFDWCVTNNLCLNVDKCYVVSYSLLQDTAKYNYTVGNSTLSRPQTVRDLGVIFDHKLSFVDHIDRTVASAYRFLGFIIRNSHDFQNSETLILLYNAYVRSRLEYASIVWEPCYEVHIDHIERVQRRFLKFLSFKSTGVYPYIGFPHDVLLRLHNSHSLQARRQFKLLSFLHGLLEGRINCTVILDMLQYNTPRPASRKADFFYLPTPRTNKLKFSPLYRLCDAYNRIHSQIDIFSCTVASLNQIILN